jgi:heptosyltransferase-2
MGTRIAVIKLGAFGDVIRTLALLPGLKRAWPTSHVTWVTRPAAARMLRHHPQIARLLPFDAESICHLTQERFDVVFSLDKEPGPAGLAMQLDAPDKRGIGLSQQGTVFPLNPECAHYFRLGLDDDLKFHQNPHSYQELIYSAVGLEYCGERYRLYPSAENRERAGMAWRLLGVRPDEVVVGLNTGAGDVFANKTWPPERFAQLAERLVLEYGWRVALLGGPREAELNRRLGDACLHLTLPGPRNPLPGVLNVCAVPPWDPGGPGELDFAALVQRCDAVVTGDTLALHVAVAGDVPTIALFGPTCAQEIDLFGRGTKLTADLPCAPCYRRTCDRSPSCMDEHSLDAVVAELRRWVGEPGRVELPQVPAAV